MGDDLLAVHQIFSSKKFQFLVFYNTNIVAFDQKSLLCVNMKCDVDGCGGYNVILHKKPTPTHCMLLNGSLTFQ